MVSAGELITEDKPVLCQLSFLGILSYIFFSFYLCDGGKYANSLSIVAIKESELFRNLNRRPE